MTELGKEETHLTEDLKRKRASDYRFVYSNITRVARTETDIHLNFALVHEDENLEPISEEVVGIGLSPQHAQRLFLILGQLLVQWEKDNGPIGATPMAITKTQAKPQDKLVPAQKQE